MEHSHSLENHNMVAHLVQEFIGISKTKRYVSLFTRLLSHSIPFSHKFLNIHFNILWKLSGLFRFSSQQKQEILSSQC
jgi:hypothetical protein